MSKRLIFSFLLLSTQAFATGSNFIAIMGGGSEPQDKETTIFDDEVKSVGKFLDATKTWKAEVSFNGGHSVTESIVNRSFQKSGAQNSPFTQEEFENMISNYEAKINNGEIKSGDQLLVYITTHGAMQAPGEVSHKIGVTGASAEDLNTLKDAKLVSMDRLQSLIDLANQKNIKLGIMDFSCHSGSSLKLQNPQTCIISASGPQHFGYNTWGDRFASNMRKGRNLEDVFLRTFENRSETAFPMISSPIGNELQDEFYELVTPFLYSWSENPNHDKLTKFLEEQVVENRCQEANDQFQELLELTRKIERETKSSFEPFRQSITEYQSLLNKIRTDLTAFDIPKLKSTKEKFCHTQNYIFPNGTNTPHEVCQEWSLKEIITMDHDKEIQRMRDFYKNKTGNDLTWSEAYIKNLEAAKNRKARLLTEDPKYAQYINYFKGLPNLQSDTWSKAVKVSRDLQDAYVKAYRQKSRSDSRPNACKNFVL